MDLSINQSDYIILGVVFIGLIYWYSTKSQRRFRGTIVPHLKPAPILGNTWKNFFQLENQIYTYGRAYNDFPDARFSGLYEVLKPIVMIRDPDLIKLMGVKEFDHFVDHNFFIDEASDPLLGNMMIVMRGKKWREMRSTLSPAFTTSKMRSMFNLVWDSAQQMTSYLKQETDAKGPVTYEMKDLFSKYANDVIANCAFGIQVDSLKDPKNTFYEFGKKVTEFQGLTVFLKFLAFNLVPSLMRLLKIYFLEKETIKTCRNLIHETMLIREKRNIIRPDMIQLLMEAKKGQLKSDEKDDSESNDNSRKWSDDELAAQALIFLVAGFSTSTSLLMFLAYELALNPEIQENLQEEIDSVLHDLKDNKLTYNDLGRLPYMDMVISETLRKWPPVTFLDRTCTKDYTLEDYLGKKYTIKKGEGILFPVYHIHRDEKYYSCPEKFDPERFNDENKKQIQPFTYMPFGVGPRNCIGSRFALMEAKALLFSISTSFNFRSCLKTEYPLQLSKKDFDLVPANGIWVELVPRKK